MVKPMPVTVDEASGVPKKKRGHPAKAPAAVDEAPAEKKLLLFSKYSKLKKDAEAVIKKAEKDDQMPTEMPISRIVRLDAADVRLGAR